MKKYIYKKPKILIKKIKLGFLRNRNRDNNIDLLSSCASCTGYVDGFCGSRYICSV